MRLHYAYPNQFPDSLLEVISKHDNICNYLDIALQHISDNVLQRMHRHVTKQDTIDLIRKMREKVPDICIRTTLLLGFPGETDEDFEELLQFVKETRFNRLGAFVYSEEEGTYAANHYKADVPESVKQERLDRLMELQRGISEELNQELIGSVLKTIIDKQEGDYYIGRTAYDSPEVDGEVYINKAENLQVGEFYDVLIQDATDYDLYGTTQYEQ